MACDTQKHAYLIIAHKDDLTFSTLIQMLDDPLNDIYVHMDVKNTSFRAEKYSTRFSRLTFTKRTDVSWGGYSQIVSEMILLEAATSAGQYMYYHLLSGEDLPIQTQSYIHHFFEQHQGTEYVRFQSNTFLYEDRVRYFYLLQEKVGKRKSLAAKILLRSQKILHIHRNRGITFQKGTNWFSITDDLARYVVSQKANISKVFRYTHCADEVFLQTVIINSDFRFRLPTQDFQNQLSMCMRLIDWERGTPYIFRTSDFEELVKSDMLFARKFDAQLDSDIILKIRDKYIQ